MRGSRPNGASEWLHQFMVLVLISSFCAGPARAEALSQQASVEEAARRNREASQLARRAGNGSIARGNSNIQHGQHMGAAGASRCALGVMQVAQGILGLLAALKASLFSDKSSNNGQSLGALYANSLYGNAFASSTSAAVVGVDSSSSVSPSGNSAASASSGRSVGVNVAGRSSAAGEVISAEQLRSGELGSALAAIQDRYGLSPEEFANALAKGADPRSLLVKAPKNALTAEEAQAAYAAAQASEAEDRKAMLASMASPGSAAASLSSGANAKPAEPEEGASSAGEAMFMNARAEGLRERLARELASDRGPEEGEMGLSPEVVAALAARELEASKLNREELSIFELVHRKYLEKCRQDLGATAKIRGVHGAESD